MKNFESRFFIRNSNFEILHSVITLSVLIRQTLRETK
jgi:hypothetical protein